MSTEKVKGAAEAIAQLERAIRARIPLIGIETPEEERAMREIERLASEPTVGVTGDVEVESRIVFKWTHTKGTVRQGKLSTNSGKLRANTAQLVGESMEIGLVACQCCLVPPVGRARVRDPPSQLP
jgi:hypothetical protein